MKVEQPILIVKTCTNSGLSDIKSSDTNTPVRVSATTKDKCN